MRSATWKLSQAGSVGSSPFWPKTSVDCGAALGRRATPKGARSGSGDVFGQGMLRQGAEELGQQGFQPGGVDRPRGRHQQLAPRELGVEAGADILRLDGGDGLGRGEPPGREVRKAGLPEGAPREAGRRLQRLARGQKRARTHPAQRIGIQARARHGEAREAHRLGQRVGERAEAALEAVATAGEGQADARIHQRVGEVHVVQVARALGQQGGRDIGQALLAARIGGRALRPGPGQRDDGDGMILDEPGGDIALLDDLDGHREAAAGRELHAEKGVAHRTVHTDEEREWARRFLIPAGASRRWRSWARPERCGRRHSPGRA